LHFRLHFFTLGLDIVNCCCFRDFFDREGEDDFADGWQLAVVQGSRLVGVPMFSDGSLLQLFLFSLLRCELFLENVHEGNYINPPLLSVTIFLSTQDRIC